MKPEDERKEKSEKEKDKLDKQLENTFPASDPPSRTRPGHGRSDKENGNKSDDDS